MNDETMAEVRASAPSLNQDDLDHMNEAERLALVVGAAYGAALADRDMARTEVERLNERLVLAKGLLDMALDEWPVTTWGTDSLAKERLVQGINALWPVDSDPTPTQED